MTKREKLDLGIREKILKKHAADGSEIMCLLSRKERATNNNLEHHVSPLYRGKYKSI